MPRAYAISRHLRLQGLNAFLTYLIGCIVRGAWKRCRRFYSGYNLAVERQRLSPIDGNADAFFVVPRKAQRSPRIPQFVRKAVPGDAGDPVRRHLRTVPVRRPELAHGGFISQLGGSEQEPRRLHLVSVRVLVMETDSRQPLALIRTDVVHAV